MYVLCMHIHVHLQSNFTTEKKNAEKIGLPDGYTVFSEIAEATSILLDPKVLAYMSKYDKSIEYIHISDQYMGVRPQEFVCLY